MTLDEILNEWDADAPHNPTELGDGSLAVTRLHAKWLRILSYERLRLRKMEAEGRQLRLAKHEFYTQGPTSETQKLGWEYPACGRVLNKDVTLYMDADKQMVDHNLQINYQGEIVAAVELIFKSIQNRSWEIARKLEDLRIKMGN